MCKGVVELSGGSGARFVTGHWAGTWSGVGKSIIPPFPIRQRSSRIVVSAYAASYCKRGYVHHFSRTYVRGRPDSEQKLRKTREQTDSCRLVLILFYHVCIIWCVCQAPHGS